MRLPHVDGREDVRRWLGVDVVAARLRAVVRRSIGGGDQGLVVEPLLHARGFRLLRGGSIIIGRGHDGDRLAVN